MIEHFSGSSMNLYDTDIHTFYTRYVLWEEPNYCPALKNAMEFWKNYEVMLWENEYKKWETQKECEMILWGYKMYGLFDFYNKANREIVEIKTRNRRRTEQEIHKSRQFRFYNHFATNTCHRFILHQYNKKEQERRVETINRIDDTFEQDFIQRAKQIERFLNSFNIEVKKYDIQEDKQSIR